MTTAGSCQVEKRLGLEQSIELDAFLADPSKWPAAIFEGWDLPPGPLPGNFRQWGAVKLGLEWCETRGETFSRRVMERHVNIHVPVLAFTPQDFAVKGTDSTVEGPRPLPAIAGNSVSFMDVYQKGLAVGHRALDLLQKRIDALEAEGKPVPIELALKLADLGIKLATSEASIRARGAMLAGQQDDDIEGFRSGSAPLPSQRMGHSRIRVVDGVSTPIRDEGPADRSQYSARARQEGSPELPHP